MIKGNELDVGTDFELQAKKSLQILMFYIVYEQSECCQHTKYFGVKNVSLDTFFSMSLFLTQ